VLTTTWEDQYPEVLGIANLFNVSGNGYMEAGCTVWNNNDATATVPSILLRAPSGNSVSAGNEYPIVGSGCGFSQTDAGDSFTSDSAPVFAGRYYVGSVGINLNDVTTGATLLVQLQDQGGTEIPAANVQWWVEGPNVGKKEKLEDSGESWPIRQRACHKGCVFKWAVLIPDGVTGLQVLFDPDSAEDASADELWMRPKLFNDLESHYLIADGPAHIQIFTDSRGSTAAAERFPASMDYMMGYTTPNGLTRTTTPASLRPNLYLDEAPSVSAIWTSGERLGNRVGPIDSNEGYNGVVQTNLIENQITDKTSYCIAFYSVNDWTSGDVSQKARPSSQALAGDAEANRHLYWVDQIRGFEQVSEKNGCQPLVILDTDHYANTTSNHRCANASGVAQNCGVSHNELMKNILHNQLTGH
jgi:hypothetical protein